MAFSVSIADVGIVFQKQIYFLNKDTLICVRSKDYFCSLIPVANVSA